MRSFFRSLKSRRGDSDDDVDFPTFKVTIPDADRDPGFPIGVPSKFDPQGNVQPFSGNTIIAHLSPQSELYASLLNLHAKLAASPLASLFALLPPESWHMTIFEGVCDSVRAPGHWPRDIAPEASLAHCTSHFARKLEHFKLGPTEQPPYRLAVTGFSSFAVGIGIRLSLRTPEEEARFRKLRDRLAETLQIKHAHHKYYELHLSMAYFLRYLDKEQKAQLNALLKGHFETMPKLFELGAPEFCTFEDMFRFDRMFYLK
ncbi:RNA ligase/cyclic nucleotide phosphodiesterase [Cercophora newfieldiana]|uniref:RNA ligase/cyclic nucleotide phosphodiesterase n=1 Tax=Cercophora newfieldiana TaxID=92897 RepID=A0AA39YTE2_9PEZI|nr:RNA ligase/cyclic nucleotide phosphodiesterase [Cercophora newfieldiana]